MTWWKLSGLIGIWQNVLAVIVIFCATIDKRHISLPVTVFFFILIYGLSLTCIEYMNLYGSIHFIVLHTTVSPEGVNIWSNDNGGMIDPSWPAFQANCPIHLKTKLELNISICYSNDNTLSAMKPRYAGDNYFKDTRWPSKALVMTYVMLEDPP